MLFLFLASSVLIGLLVVALVALLKPHPEAVHQPAPCQKEDDAHPHGDRRPIGILVVKTLKGRYVGIIVSAGTEIKAVHQPQPIGHNIERTEYHRNAHAPGDHTHYLATMLFHQLNRKRWYGEDNAREEQPDSKQG